MNTPIQKEIPVPKKSIQLSRLPLPGILSGVRSLRKRHAELSHGKRMFMLAVLLSLVTACSMISARIVFSVKMIHFIGWVAAASGLGLFLDASFHTLFDADRKYPFRLIGRGFLGLILIFVWIFCLRF